MAVIIQLFCTVQNYFTEYNKIERHEFFFNTLQSSAFENNITGIPNDDNLSRQQMQYTFSLFFMEGKFPHFHHVKVKQSAYDCYNHGLSVQYLFLKYSTQRTKK